MFSLTWASPSCCAEVVNWLSVVIVAYRYYTAEGVRIYSQETWNTVTGGKGKQLVEQHIDSVV